MKKVVLKSTIEDEISKRRAMKAVAVAGVDSIAVDIKEGKITVVGDADPVCLTTKLRKIGFTAELLSVGPAKEEKKEEKKSDQGPAKEDKKDAEKKKPAEPVPTPTVHVYHVNSSSYGPYTEGYTYTVVRDEYPNTSNACTIL